MNLPFSIKSSLVIAVFFPLALLGQADSVKSELINRLTEKVSRNYVDAGIARTIKDSLQYKLVSGAYDSTLNMDEFCFELTRDLRRISKDNHFMIHPSHFKPLRRTGHIKLENKSHQYWKRYHKREKRRFDKFLKRAKKSSNIDDFNFGEIKILPGNVGYVEINDFASSVYKQTHSKARTSIRSVMRFLSGTNSIIVDFRENLGGSIIHSARLCSYFTDVTNAYYITTESVSRFDSMGVTWEYVDRNKIYTDKKIDKRLVGGKEVFVLISKRTFSAGELATYKLKQLNKRLVVVGEKTSGGGNAHTGLVYDDYFFALIPRIKVFDENNSNYAIDQNGVKPDIEVSSDSAFDLAYRLAVGGTQSPIPGRTKYFKSIKTIGNEREHLFQKHYGEFVGDYRKIKVNVENERLYITYDQYTKVLLVGDAMDFFLAKGFEFVRFKRDSFNKVVEIQVKHKDGYLERFRKL